MCHEYELISNNLKRRKTWIYDLWKQKEPKKKLAYRKWSNLCCSSVLFEEKKSRICFVIYSLIQTNERENVRPRKPHEWMLDENALDWYTITLNTIMSVYIYNFIWLKHWNNNIKYIK